MSKKILVVDDEKPLAKALEIKLNKSGFEATSVFDGQSAIENLKSGQYEILVLDLIMPDIDGWQILNKIKELGIKIKVFISSNLGQPEDIERAKCFGVLDFFVKSDCTLEQIVSKIKEYGSA